jgi:NAD(P)-dependent dehydrogenase (short-subunit alcohol dehydrogenase family)
VVPLDVTNDESVAGCAAYILGEGGLDGLVNNAGGGAPASYDGYELHVATVRLNFTGTVKVTEACLPLLSDGGRIVMLSSGSAPSFVAKCSAEKQALICKPSVTMAEIQGVVDECEAIAKAAADTEAAEAAFAAAGYGSNSYGLSKALMHSYAHVPRASQFLTDPRRNYRIRPPSLPGARSDTYTCP